MATITLYKDKINGVGSLLDNIIKCPRTIPKSRELRKILYQILILEA